MIMCLLFFSVTYAQSNSTKKILILNSYHKGFEWTDDQVSAAEKVLSEGTKHVDLFVEYMDTKRIYSKAYLENLLDIYRLKYKKVHLDAIITTDDNALWFVLQYHKEVFGEAPVSFCGINDYRKFLMKEKQHYTGLVEVLDIKPTIDLALNLHPKTRKIVVIVDSTPTGLGQKKDIAAVAQHYGNVKFEYIEGKDTSHSELLEKLRSLSQDTIVLLSVWLRDKNNVYLSPNEGGLLISSKSTVPIYGIIDMYYGYGIVGGKLLNSRTHGRIAAEIAFRIINGEKPANIPVIFKSTNPYMFDYKQLERWKINLADLPQDSIIINKPVSLYKEYKRLIWIVIGAFTFLIFIVLMLLINILSRKKTEKTLQDSEKKWRNVLEKTPQIGLSLNKNGEITFVNAHFLVLTGWKKDDVIEQNWFDIFVPENVRDKVKTVFFTVMAQKDTIGLSNYENEIIGKSGEVFNVAWSNVLTKDTAGNVVDVTCLGLDLTERKRSENKLKKSEAKYRTIMEAAQDPVYVCSENHKIQYMNPAMIDRIGHDATGQLCYEALHGFNKKCKWCKYEETFQNGYTEKNIISPLDNRSFHVSSTVFVNENESLSKLSILRDTTEFIELQKRLQQAQKMEAIGNLAGGIAHDFNNILFPIIGMSEMMMEDLSVGSQEQKYANEINKAGHRAKELVAQILSFSRQSDQEKIPVRFQKVLKEVLKLCRSTIPANIKVEQKIEQDCGAIRGNTTQLHQIGMNLITNAYHAVQEKNGKITVALEEITVDRINFPGTINHPGNYLLFTVSDDGIGMTHKVKEKIFEPYFTTKEQGKGTGLGLAVVYGIVKEYGGDIQVETKIESGTTFRVYLPLIDESESKEVSKTKAKLETGHEHILLVDDEEPVIRLEKQILERLGYQITSCSSSLDAVDIFRSNPNAFDIVITDVSMPDMTGDQLAKEILSIKPDIPIIICTGFSERITKEQAETIGIKGFLMKPIAKSDIAHEVRKVLDACKPITD